VVGLVELAAGLHRTERVTALHVEPDGAARAVEKVHRAGLRRRERRRERARDALQAGASTPTQGRSDGRFNRRGKGSAQLADGPAARSVPEADEDFAEKLPTAADRLHPVA